MLPTECYLYLTNDTIEIQRSKTTCAIYIARSGKARILLQTCPTLKHILLLKTEILDQNLKSRWRKNPGKGYEDGEVREERGPHAIMRNKGWRSFNNEGLIGAFILQGMGSVPWIWQLKEKGKQKEDCSSNGRVKKELDSMIWIVEKLGLESKWFTGLERGQHKGERERERWFAFSRRKNLSTYKLRWWRW